MPAMTPTQRLHWLEYQPGDLVREEHAPIFCGPVVAVLMVFLMAMVVW